MRRHMTRRARVFGASDKAGQLQMLAKVTNTDWGC